MKTTLLLLSVLVGCASPRHQSLVVDGQSGLFNGESLLRLHGAQQTCYQEDLNAFTQRARSSYAQGAKTASYWSEVGNCLAWYDELREARFFLGLGLELAKTKQEEAMIKNNIAVIYLRQGRVSRAYDLLQEAQGLANNFVTPAFNLAQLYISQNLNQEGLKILQRAPFAQSVDAEVLHLKGLAHLQMMQTKVAGQFLSQIPASFYTRPDVALTLAQWHNLEGRPEVALDFLKNRKTGLAKSADRLAERVERDAKAMVAAREESRK